MRRPIQFSLMTSYNNTPMVLCDDGALWEGIRDTTGPGLGAVLRWRQLPPVPGPVTGAEHTKDRNVGADRDPQQKLHGTEMTLFQLHEAANRICRHQVNAKDRGLKCGMESCQSPLFPIIEQGYLFLRCVVCNYHQDYVPQAFYAADQP